MEIGVEVLVKRKNESTHSHYTHIFHVVDVIHSDHHSVTERYV